MRPTRIAAPVVCFSLLLMPVSLHAGGCFGRLSDQEPCSTATGGAHISSTLPRLVAPPLRGGTGSRSRPLNARVVNTQLRNLADQRGEWSGTVTGFGRVVLYLQIVKHAQLLEELRIGEVDLSGSPLPFRFRAQLPAVVGWDWRISARAY